MKCLLIDNGSKHLVELQSLLSKYGQVIVSSEPILQPEVDIVVLSGGSKYAVQEHPDKYIKEIELIKNCDKPILGICLGCELIGYAFGCKLKELVEPQNGLRSINIISRDGIFYNISDFKVYESHKWGITTLSEEIIGLAKSDTGYEVIKHRDKNIYGFQFHPEMFEERSCGDEIFNNVISVFGNR